MSEERIPEPRRSRLSTYNQVALAAAATVALCYFGRLVIMPTLMGVAFALLLGPFVDACARVRIPRSLSALLLITLTLTVMYAATHLLYDLVTEFLDELPRHSAKFDAFFDAIRKKLDSLAKTTRLLGNTPEPSISVRQPIDWPKLVIGGANSLGEFLFITSFVPFITYFLLTWQNHLYRATVRMFSVDRRSEVERTMGQIASMMRSVLVGNLLVGLLIGVLSTVLFALVHVPYFYILGFVSGLLSMVPYLGSVLAVLPPLLMGLGQLSGSGVLALGMGVLLLHLLAINLLVPKMIGKRVQINPLAATLSLLLWGVLWGGIGLLFAVPIAAAIKIVCDHIEPLHAIGAWLGDDLDEDPAPKASAAEHA